MQFDSDKQAINALGKKNESGLQIYKAALKKKQKELKTKNLE